MASKSDTASQAELVQYARDAAARSEDLYAALGVDATTAADDIHRAWRRRQLQLHPDKAGDAYDASALDRLNRARDVLLSAEARAAYDGAMRAALLKREQYEKAEKGRRDLIDDLERRERRAAGERGPQRAADPAAEALKREMAERGRKRMEERARLVREAEERERERERQREAQLDERQADIERALEQRKAERAARKAGRRAKDKAASPKAEVRPDDMDVDTAADRPPRDERSAPIPTSGTRTEDTNSKTTTTAPVVEPTTASSAPLSDLPLQDIIAATCARLRAKQAEIDASRQRAPDVAATSA